MQEDTIAAVSEGDNPYIDVNIRPFTASPNYVKIIFSILL